MLVKSCFHFLLSKESFIDFYKSFLLYLLLWVNIFYMHYEVFISRYGFINIVSPLFFMTMDVVFTVLIFHILTLGRRKITYVLSYIFISLVVFSNVIYSRFFEQYLTIGILNESSNFKGFWWIPYIKDSFRWSDLLLIVTGAVYIFVLKGISSKRKYNYYIVLLLILFITSVTHFVAGTREENISLRSKKQLSDWTLMMGFGSAAQQGFMFNQEKVIFKYGLLKNQFLFSILKNTMPQKLSTTETNLIDNYVDNANKKLQPLFFKSTIKDSPNIVFIIVESYLSLASKLTIDGHAITPNINRLMLESGTYSNMNVISNKGLGESSDAQLSYFTGLIPLEDEISVDYVIRDKLIALPTLLHEQKGYHTYITVPTYKAFWHQTEANLKYGIETTLEMGNDKNNYWCQDEELFERLQSYEFNEPYLNVILTLSMHGSYNTRFVPYRHFTTPFKYPQNYSAELCNYLDKCYYTDMQIGRYIHFLKSHNKYNNCVIIITSDHQPLPNSLRANVNDKSLPLILVNSGINVNSFYNGPINQIDLYPTLLDIFDLKSNWRGLGNSLVRNGYSCVLDENKRKLSKLILRGNYFDCFK